MADTTVVALAVRQRYGPGGFCQFLITDAGFQDRCIGFELFMG